ncbi:MAG: hydantoin racemase [Streptosporangiales bacterium]|nr:hydantoin racemase [Streptosporangiales bacterium]
MTTRILWLNPVATDVYDAPIAESLRRAAAEHTHLDVLSLEPPGPTHLEYSCYEMTVGGQLMATVRWAEDAGYDALIIGCFYDTGLRAAREIATRMVVTAPAEACLHLAATLGDTISVLVGRRKWLPEMRDNAERYGFGGRIASFRVLDMGVHDFQRDADTSKARILREARAAVEEDRAETIVLGCTIEYGFYEEVQRQVGVPVIDATLAPLKYAEYLADVAGRFGWRHSKVGGYQSPPAEEAAAWIPGGRPTTAGVA